MKLVFKLLNSYKICYAKSVTNMAHLTYTYQIRTIIFRNKISFYFQKCPNPIIIYTHFKLPSRSTRSIYQSIIHIHIYISSKSITSIWANIQLFTLCTLCKPSNSKHISLLNYNNYTLSVSYTNRIYARAVSIRPYADECNIALYNLCNACHVTHSV